MATTASIPHVALVPQHPIASRASAPTGAPPPASPAPSSATVNPTSVACYSPRDDQGVYRLVSLGQHPRERHIQRYAAQQIERLVNSDWFQQLNVPPSPHGIQVVLHEDHLNINGHDVPLYRQHDQDVILYIQDTLEEINALYGIRRVEDRFFDRPSAPRRVPLEEVTMPITRPPALPIGEVTMPAVPSIPIPQGPVHPFHQSTPRPHHPLRRAYSADDLWRHHIPPTRQREIDPLVDDDAFSSARSTPRQVPNA